MARRVLPSRASLASLIINSHIQKIEREGTSAALSLLLRGIKSRVTAEVQQHLTENILISAHFYVTLQPKYNNYRKWQKQVTAFYENWTAWRHVSRRYQT
jgi:hypothetical protein